MSIEAVTVGSSSTIVAAAATKRTFLALQNVSDEAISIKMDESATVITAGLGIVLNVGDPPFILTCNHQQFDHEITAICASGGKVLNVTEIITPNL